MRAVALGLVVAIAGACAPAWKDTPHQMPYQKVERPVMHPRPVTGWAVSDWWDFGLHSVVVPFAKSLSPARWMAAAFGNKPALDINAFGKVPDSPWFRNRITRGDMTLEELVRGPNRLGPPPDGDLVVLSGKTDGNTPGLVLRDSAGSTWFVKFDPPALRELSTSAELIASKFFHAAGYWVPETYILDLDVSRLTLAKDAWTRDSYDRRIPLREKQLRELIALMNPNLDGRLRTLFSRGVPGVALGPFSYRGVRVGDPNDRIPHQRRRSLRGLWVLAAWLNNTDIRRQNTLDTFIATDAGAGYIRHYLIDFGDSLGAAGDREKYKGEGYEARLDWSEIGKRGFALGLYYPYWLPLRRSPYRAVGIFESKVFDPERWYPVVENPAFEEAEAEDTFWGASILAHFTDSRIRAVVESAGYSERGAAEFVSRILSERRVKLLRRAFRDMLAVDEPIIRGKQQVAFVDLAAIGGLDDRRRLFEYRVSWTRTRSSDLELTRGRVGGAPVFDLADAVANVVAKHGKAFREDPFLTLELWRVGRDPRVRLRLRVVRDFLIPVALER